MAIGNELSGDIAVAILGGKEISRGNISDLRETVLKVHSILQQLSEQDRDKVAGEAPANASDAALSAAQ